MNIDRPIYYIGPFDGKIGGVTVKNNCIYDNTALKKHIVKIDTLKIKKLNLKLILLLLYCIFIFKGTLIIGVSTVNGRNRWLSRLLYIFNRKAMNHSLFFVMGGTFSLLLKNDCNYLKYVANYKKIFVETKGLKDELTFLGLQNIFYFPNCRKQPSVHPTPVFNKQSTLKLVFLSMIYPEKGVDIILQASRSLKNVSIDFYGSISNAYFSEFISQVNLLENCSYKGIFKDTPDNLYKMLNQYDALLFPTKMITEGVPGCLIEAKISGITIIASDISFNRELITDNKDGILLKENSADELISAINFLHKNRNFLYSLKKESSTSSMDYFIDKYVNDLF